MRGQTFGACEGKSYDHDKKEYVPTNCGPHGYVQFLIRATFGDITDPKTRDVSLRNRRIGVGHFGFAGFVAKQGIKFSESYKDDEIRYALSILAAEVQNEVERYSHELRIPTPVKSRTVAPTGTIAKLAGRSEGIHPVFAKFFIRRIRYSTVDESQATKIEEYRTQGYSVVPDPMVPNTMIVEIPLKELLVEELEARGIDANVLEDASEISLTDHLGVQEMYQTLWADNAVSYTVNFSPVLESASSLMSGLRPYLRTLKGTTMFPERGYELAPYERVTEGTYNALRGNLADFYDSSVDDNCATGACPVKQI